MKLKKHSAILQFVSTSCHLPSGKLTLENYNFSWVNPLFRPFSIAFCMFTRGYLVQTRTGLGHPRPGEATDSSRFSFKPLSLHGQKQSLVESYDRGRFIPPIHICYGEVGDTSMALGSLFHVIPYLVGGFKHIFIFHNTWDNPSH